MVYFDVSTGGEVFVAFGGLYVLRWDGHFRNFHILDRVHVIVVLVLRLFLVSLVVYRCFPPS